MREEAIERYLCRRAEELGGQVRKVAWIGRRGAPDRLVLVPGHPLLFVELKQAGGRLTTAQLREMRLLEDCGADVCVVRSRSEVDRLMDRYRG